MQARSEEGSSIGGAGGSLAGALVPTDPGSRSLTRVAEGLAPAVEVEAEASAEAEVQSYSAAMASNCAFALALVLEATEPLADAEASAGSGEVTETREAMEARILARVTEGETKLDSEMEEMEEESARSFGWPKSNFEP